MKNVSTKKASPEEDHQENTEMSAFPISVFVLSAIVAGISGHGRLSDPPNRSSLWRVVPHAPINYNDDENYCGGYSTQWEVFGGKCGVCGDPYGDPHPQANENTGQYGKGIIAKEYTSGSIIDVQVVLTTNHMGYFTFSLCVLSNPNAPESGEDCFEPLTLGDGSSRHVLPNNREVRNDTINTTVKLPDGLQCERCVFRWTYTAGNNWGECEDGTGHLGCGPQETFRSCSDITIR